MRYRHGFLHVILTLLLLFSQQLGIAHAVTHLSSPAESSSPRNNQLPDQLPEEMQCATCLAFASIGSALSDPHHAAFACLALGENAHAIPAQDPLPLLLRAFNPRAPPSRS